MKMLDILNKQLGDLIAERDAHIAKLEALPELLEAESRSATDAEDAEYRSVVAAVEVIDGKVDGLRAEITKLEKIAERKDLATRRAPVVAPEHRITSTDAVRMSNADARGAALTFVERNRNFASDSHRQAVTELIERNGSTGAAVARMALATGTDDYVSAWGKYLTGREIELTDSERQALAVGRNHLTSAERAMTSGTGSTGGYLVPVFVDPSLVITGAGSINPMRQLASVRQIGPAYGGWYGSTAAQVTASWDAEGAEVSDDAPTLTQVNIPVYKANAFVPVSFEAFEDIADLAADVVELFQDAKDNLEAVAHFTGAGSTLPKGVVAAAGAITASRVSPATGGAIAIADVFSVNDAVPARFRGSQSLAWAASNVVLSKIRQLAMAQNSANSVWTDVAGATPRQLLGIPAYEASAMSASLTTGQDVLICGDFSRYRIVDRVGFSIEFIPNLFSTGSGRPTGQRGWFAHWRTGGDVVDVNAFRLLRL